MPNQRAARHVQEVDTRFLESLLGYNARRAALVLIEPFMARMAAYALRPVDFSVLSLIARNPGITSRQLCDTLSILAPNLVGMVKSLEQRGLILRQPHPRDGRATGLHASADGITLARQAEQTALDLDSRAGASLSAAERKTLLRLLKKIYK